MIYHTLEGIILKQFRMYLSLISAFASGATSIIDDSTTKTALLEKVMRIEVTWRYLVYRSAQEDYYTELGEISTNTFKMHGNLYTTF